MQGSHPRTGVDARSQYLRVPFGEKILTGGPYCGCTGMEQSTRLRVISARDMKAVKTKSKRDTMCISNILDYFFNVYFCLEN